MIRRGRAITPIVTTATNYYRYVHGQQATYGADQNRNTGSSYPRQTGRIMLARTMLVNAILADIRIADTYICRFVTAINGTTSAFDVNTAHVSAGGGEDTITPTNGDFIMTPGLYYLQLITHDAASVGWSDLNARYYEDDQILLAGIYYTATEFEDYSMPVKFRGYVLEQDRFTRYQKM